MNQIILLFLLLSMASCSVFNSKHEMPAFQEEEMLTEAMPVEEQEDEENLTFEDFFLENVPPFEKIYVHPYEILSTPFGTFHITPEGKREPIRAIHRDCNGTYIIKITQICPECGRQHKTKLPLEEGYDCPLWKIEVMPRIWYSP